MAETESTRETPPPERKSLPFGQRFGTIAWGLLLAAIWAWVLLSVDTQTTTLPYSEFKDALDAGRVVSCEIDPDEIRGQLRPESRIGAPGEGTLDLPNTELIGFRTVRVDDPDLLEELRQASVEVEGALPSIWPQMFAWLLPVGLILLFWIYILRRAGGGLGQATMGFGKSRARLVADQDIDVSFRDVAGCEEAKAELAEVVDFLQHPERFTSVGAKIPKGVLLVGPPGTGKTLLARAVAGQANVPFFSLSGSDFVEMFVGVGAARVRDLFQQAKEHAPCIVFIDELDAIGRTRGVHVSNVNDEREHTLNQLLVEMDGFEPNAGVILLSATNRPDVLDPALLRPGRFDRQVVLDSPDVDGRRAILEVHARGKPLAPDLDLSVIARTTPGFRARISQTT